MSKATSHALIITTAADNKTQASNNNEEKKKKKLIGFCPLNPAAAGAAGAADGVFAHALVQKPLIVVDKT